MESVCVTDTITGTSSFNPYKQPYGVGSPIVTTSDKGAEAQRGQLTCSESHSWLATELGLELGVTSPCSAVRNPHFNQPGIGLPL